MLQAWGLSDKGSVRANNQDCFAIAEHLRLCVVADGMGGHNAGDIAARAAVDTLITVIGDRASAQRVGWPFGFDRSLSEAANLMRTAIHLANTRVLEIAARCRAYAGMGTTIVAALEVDGQLTVGHVGDSRLYRLTAGRLRQLTGDDSWMAMMANDPGADPSTLRHHPLRHVLTNVVGRRRHAEVHVIEESLASGDRLLLTTDGVHGVVEDCRLEAVLTDTEDLGRVPAELIRTALAGGSRDNCTAVVVEYNKGTP